MLANNLALEGIDATLVGTHVSSLVQSRAILRLAPEADVVVLAQYSMARVMSVLPDDIPVRVLSSPHLGIAHLKQILTASPTS